MKEKNEKGGRPLSDDAYDELEAKLRTLTASRRKIQVTHLSPSDRFKNAFFL